MNYRHLLLPLLFLTLLLASCETTRPFIPDPSQQVQIRVDEELLKDCEPLPENVQIVEPDDILKQLATGAKIAGDCRRRHRELASIVRKYIVTNPQAAASAPPPPKTEKSQ